jgi:transcription initiation factor TFIIIB Brf1 subunit/transcription initiation factor TFIIB
MEEDGSMNEQEWQDFNNPILLCSEHPLWMNCTCQADAERENSIRITKKIQAEELRKLSEQETAKLASSNNLRTAIARMDFRIADLNLTHEQKTALLICLKEIRAAAGIERF